jgi:ComF family protein
MLPDCCAFCLSGIEEGFFCARCLGDLPRIHHACERCGIPLTGAPPPGVPCADCQRRPSAFTQAASALHYRFPVDAALKALKFRRRLHHAPAFASLLRPILERSFPAVDALVPVPLHRWRQAARGFNQAYELCKPLARELDLPLAAGTHRIRRTRPQTGLSAAERRRNLRNAFVVTGRLHCRHPLIVDDVMTTGETCRQLALALLRAGAEDVGVLTVARASLSSGRR